MPTPPRAFVVATLLACSLVAFRAADAQSSPPDSVRVARLASLGRVWGAVKYFHPALVSRPVDWDSALVAAIPRVRAANSRAEFAAAVDRMLVALGDPLTRVVPWTAAEARLASSKKTHLDWWPDSTLVVTIGDAADFASTMQAFQRGQADIGRARQIVFDLRTGGEAGELGTLSYVLANSGINNLLVSRPISAPGFRTRMYSGFPTQAGGTSGGYWAGFNIVAGDVFEPRPNNPERRIVFVADTGSDVPSIALALQQAGSGTIVVEGTSRELPQLGNRWYMRLADSVGVSIRVGELVAEDGMPGVSADTAVGAIAGIDAALDLALQLVHRPAQPRQRAAMAAPYTPPPERAYAEMRNPSLEYRLLGAFRYWNAINYFYPYKSLMGEDWNAVLAWAIPKFENARDSLQYAMATSELVSRIHDSHGTVQGSALPAYFGIAPPGLKVRYVEGKVVVTEVDGDSATRASGARLGDVVVRVDGQAVTERRARMAPYLASSTPQALDARVAQRILNGADNSTAVLTVVGADGREREVRVPRRMSFYQSMRWTRPGPTWKVLPGNIGYVDLERLTVPQVDSMFDALKNTKAIIFDNRSYPQGTAWSIAPRLTDREDVVGARFQRPLVMSPDSTEWNTHAFVQLLPRTTKPRYHGKTVMLLDERTISQAEHTALFFEAANGTKFVGLPTMGANGDVTVVVLPGNLIAAFTGHDVRHADGRQLQRVGITPDVLVRPTIAGIRAGKDEVLERAIRLVETGR
jgi:C-terminal processing protease CtpA/Prc